MQTARKGVEVTKTEQEYFSIAEFARMFGLNRQTAYNLVKRGVIKAVRLAGTSVYRISRQAIEDYKKASEGYEQ